ncbi:unnamed protein product, partial [Heterosigma akashiwo]
GRRRPVLGRPPCIKTKITSQPSSAPWRSWSGSWGWRALASSPRRRPPVPPRPPPRTAARTAWNWTWTTIWKAWRATCSRSQPPPAAGRARRRRLISQGHRQLRDMYYLFIYAKDDHIFFCMPLFVYKNSSFAAIL